MNTVPYAFAFIISGLAGVLLSYLMIRFTALGVWGIIIGQVIPQALYNYWKWPRVVLKRLDITSKDVVAIGTKEIIEKYKMILGR